MVFYYWDVMKVMYICCFDLGSIIFSFKDFSNVLWIFVFVIGLILNKYCLMVVEEIILLCILF